MNWKGIKKTKTVKLSMNVGIHGENFKYLPTFSVGDEEHYPRIIHIAGVYPSITIDELYLPQAPVPVKTGFWSYEFPEPNSHNLGMVAVPGSDHLSSCKNLVALISSTDKLGMQGDQEKEVVILVDRGNTQYHEDDFFLVQTNSNNKNDELEILWLDEEDFRKNKIVGKIALCILPYDPEKKNTGFLEEED